MLALLLERAIVMAKSLQPAAGFATTVALPPLTDQATAGGESGQFGARRGAALSFPSVGAGRAPPFE